MAHKFSHSQNVLDSGFATVTSGGHWFHATRETVKQNVPGLLDRQEYEELVMNAVDWIESTDSLSLVLFFILVFLMPAWAAALITITFYFLWYYYKSAFVNIPMIRVLEILNHDAFLLGTAAVILTLLGMEGYYAGLLYGILFFFLFKVGLLRLLLNRMEMRQGPSGLTLSDRVFQKVLIRYAMYEDVLPSDVRTLEDQLTEAFQRFQRKK